MKTQHLTSFKRLAAVLALPAISILFGPQAQAAPFISGNVVVLQEDDGSVALSTASSPVFLLEYLPSTTSQANPVQVIAIPTSGASRLTQSSGSASEGFITRSLNTSNVTFVGYDAPAGIASVPGTSANPTNRCWGQVDFNGNYTRGASGSSTAFNGSNIRSSTSDGSNYWMSGTSVPATAAGGEGIWYSSNGAPWIQIITSANVNTRVTRIYNGNLYYSVAGTISGFSGLPTNTATATATGIASSSIYDFAINPGGTVAYICDDGGASGGIQKWTNNGATFVKAFNFGSTNGLTAGCRGLAVDFSGVNPVIYATTADSATKVIEITDTSDSGAITNTTDKATILATAAANIAFRGVALAPPSTSTGTAPAVSGINPSSLTTNAGSTVTFTLTGGVGYPAASNFWYKIVGTTTNLISGATASTLTLASVSAADAASYFAILANASGSATSSVASLTVVSKPSISDISPLSATNNAGSTVTFTLTANTGTPVASNFWYKVVGTTTNLIPGATATTLTLGNVLGGDTANYFAILTNASGSATSAVASLTVINDPNIAAQPASAFGLLDGTAQFTVSAFGTSPSYRWYFTDGSGNIIAQVINGTQSSSSVVSGANTSTLTIANLQLADPTNFVVVVSNAYNSVTSSVASLLAINTANSTLAFWDFNGSEFTNFVVNPNCVYNPAPYLGVGTAEAVGSTFFPGPYPPNFASTANSPFSGAVDANDGVGFTSHLPPFSWGTSHYPLTGGNKQNGVQFNVSTVAAKNIKVSYESRVSATGSDYERLQYTTNGTDWIDYPSSSSFNGIGTTYLPYHYDLTGFPGVANNPSFGIRVVTEFQSTATYGVSGNTNYLGTANTYSSGGVGGFAAGTATYDLVTFSGDAITNNNLPPSISGFMDTNSPDYIPTTNKFTVSDDTTPPDLLTYSAVSLNPGTVTPVFTFGGSGTNRTLVITPNSIRDPVAAAPIFVTVTDTNGDSTAAWFLLTLTSSNLPPTNSLTALVATNTLANAAIMIPFTVGDDHTPVSSLTDYTVASDNNTLIPAANIVVGNQGTANPLVTITPALNQLGVALISVTLNDDDSLEPKTTPASIAFMVRPNTNVVAIDYFGYDDSPPNSLDVVSAGFWTHLSGNFGQMKVNSGVVAVDTLDNTESLQTALLGSPFRTNSGGVLYSSFIVNMNDPIRQPRANGTYFAMFNDGSGNTANVEGCVVVATNGAAPGNYRLGIANVVGATALTAQMFPQDLIQGTNYMVVTALVLSNGFSTLWVNPGDQSSPSVADTTPAAATNLYNIREFELRESGSNGGSVSLSYLKVGTTFDSVFPSLQIRQNGSNAILNWSDPTLGIQSATNVVGPYGGVSGATPPFTNDLTTHAMKFFRFGQ